MRLVVGIGGLEVFLSLFMVKEMRIEFTVQHQHQSNLHHDIAVKCSLIYDSFLAQLVERVTSTGGRHMTRSVVQVG